MNIDAVNEMNTAGENFSEVVSPDMTIAPTEIDEQTGSEITSRQNAKTEVKPEYTVEYILSRMEEIRKDTEYLEDALSALKHFEPSLASNGGHGDAKRAEAILEVVKSREQILQKELSMLEQMYYNLSGKKELAKIYAIKKLLEEIKFPTDNDTLAAYMTETIRDAILSIND